MFSNQLIKRALRKAILIVLTAINCLATFSQVYTNKEVGKKNEALIDSLSNTEYPYILPILGKKVAKLGYDLPYSAGLGVNVLWQQSDLVIDNLKLGFNGGTPIELDEIVRFNHAISEATALNIRPDVWILPFLNIYGIFATAKPSTSVGFGVFIPDSSNNWHEVANYATKASFTSNTFGIGMTPTIGIGGGWLALDMNMTWTDVSALDKPVFSYIFGPRLGKTFKFKKPQQNVAFWVGGFRLKFGSQTNGSINVSDVVPADGEAGKKIDAGLQKVAENQAQIDAWWKGLTPPQQSNPANKAKYEVANKALAKAGSILSSADAALSTIGSSTIQYSLDKKVKDMWNFIVGGQFQLNKHWMIRGEYGFLGSRQQFLGGLQYRFGL